MYMYCLSQHAGASIGLPPSLKLKSLRTAKSVLQCVAVSCNVLQYVAVLCSAKEIMFEVPNTNRNHKRKNSGLFSR